MSIKNPILSIIKGDLEKGISDSKSILSNLKKIGKIDDKTDASTLISLLNHKNKLVRLEAVKHLGKITGKKIENSLINLFKNDSDSMVRRECISSLGRNWYLSPNISEGMQYGHRKLHLSVTDILRSLSGRPIASRLSSESRASPTFVFIGLSVPMFGA